MLSMSASNWLGLAAFQPRRDGVGMRAGDGRAGSSSSAAAIGASQAMRAW
jgi:hypothetical protein